MVEMLESSHPHPRHEDNGLQGLEERVHDVLVRLDEALDVGSVLDAGLERGDAPREVEVLLPAAIEVDARHLGRVGQLRRALMVNLGRGGPRRFLGLGREALDRPCAPKLRGFPRLLWRRGCLPGPLEGLTGLARRLVRRLLLDDGRGQPGLARLALLQLLLVDAHAIGRLVAQNVRAIPGALGEARHIRAQDRHLVLAFSA